MHTRTHAHACSLTLGRGRRRVSSSTCSRRGGMRRRRRSARWRGRTKVRALKGHPSAAFTRATATHVQVASPHLLRWSPAGAACACHFCWYDCMAADCSPTATGLTFSRLRYAAVASLHSPRAPLPQPQSSRPRGAAAGCPAGRPTWHSTPPSPRRARYWTPPPSRRAWRARASGRCCRRRACLSTATTRWSPTTCRRQAT